MQARRRQLGEHGFRPPLPPPAVDLVRVLAGGLSARTPSARLLHRHPICTPVSAGRRPCTVAVSPSGSDASGILVPQAWSSAASVRDRARQRPSACPSG